MTIVVSVKPHLARMARVNGCKKKSRFDDRRAILAIVSPAFSDEVQDLKQRLFNEGVPSQRLYRQRLLDGCSFHCRYEVFLARGDTQAEESVVILDYPSRVIETNRDVSCVNEKYGFELLRQDENRPWSVSAIASTDTEGFLRRGMIPESNSLTLEELLIHDEILVLDVMGVPIERFIATPTIAIVGVRADEKGRVAVEFSGVVPIVIGKGNILGGTIWFSPDMHWAIDEYLVDVTSEETSTIAEGQIQRAVQWLDVDGLPVPMSVSTKSFPGGQFHLERRLTYHQWEIKSFTPERFGLSHYGLPEPGLVTSRIDVGSCER